MKKIKIAIVAFLTLVFTTLFPVLTANATHINCFKVGEYISGFNKICTYSCLGSDVAITIGSMQFCPISYRANHY